MKDDFRPSLDEWPVDGRGHVTPQEDGGVRVQVLSPLTLWCPERLDGPFEVSFTCTLHTPDTAMLLLACAQAWRGPAEIPARPRQGDYAEYAWQDLQMYTLGFNRCAHVSHDVQPNASRMNVRRIGGAAQVQYADVDLRDPSPAMQARWKAWDRSTILCSVLEHESGIGIPLSYRFAFDHGRIEACVQGRTSLVAQDRAPEPLAGGYFAIRNMTPGASFTLKDLKIGRS